MDLESVAGGLKMLATRERLFPLEINRAKDLMEELKRSGMSNSVMVEVAGEWWSESIVKGLLLMP